MLVLASYVVDFGMRRRDIDEVGPDRGRLEIRPVQERSPFGRRACPPDDMPPDGIGKTALGVGAEAQEHLVQDLGIFVDDALIRLVAEIEVVRLEIRGVETRGHLLQCRASSTSRPASVDCDAAYRESS